VLEEAGLSPSIPQGTYFILAEFSRVFEGDDRAFARHLVERHGVAAIPPSVFYAGATDEGTRLIRFAFPKQIETLRAAALRLKGLQR
jgi:aspartate/methionine/tyrosine aminotransferase